MAETVLKVLQLRSDLLLQRRSRFFALRHLLGIAAETTEILPWNVWGKENEPHSESRECNLAKQAT